jgi:ribosome-associated heat shock protein Hsp15
MTPEPEEGDDRLRIDRWLWCTRFYRSRSDARRAVAGGQVHVNGARVKPSRALRPGDILQLTRGLQRLAVTVKSIPLRRGPAPEAAAHYLLEVLEDRRPGPGIRGPAPAPESRPGKRDRRRLRALSGKGSG